MAPLNSLPEFFLSAWLAADTPDLFHQTLDTQFAEDTFSLEIARDEPIIPTNHLPSPSSPFDRTHGVLGSSLMVDRLRRKGKNTEEDPVALITGSVALLPEVRDYFEPFCEIAQAENTLPLQERNFIPDGFVLNAVDAPARIVNTGEVIMTLVFPWQESPLMRSLYVLDGGITRFVHAIGLPLRAFSTPISSSPHEYTPLEDAVGLIGGAIRAEKLGFNHQGWRAEILEGCDMPALAKNIAKHSHVGPRALKNDLKQSEDPNRSVVELVSNSLDHARTSDFADVDVTAADGFYEVLDRGSGMTEDKITESLLLPKVSDKPSEQENIGGFGIGFYTVFRHLNKNGDQVVVETKAADGSAYRIIFIMKHGRIVMRSRRLDLENEGADFLQAIADRPGNPSLSVSAAHGTRIRVYSSTIVPSVIANKLFEFHRHVAPERALRLNGNRINLSHESDFLATGAGYSIHHVPNAKSGISIVCGDVVIEQYPTRAASRLGEIILKLPAGIDRLSMSRTQIKLDDTVVAGFLALVELSRRDDVFTSLRGKIDFLNILAPLARAFEMNRRNETAVDCVRVLQNLIVELTSHSPVYPDTPGMRAALKTSPDILIANAELASPCVARNLLVPPEFQGGHVTHEGNRTQQLRLVITDDLRVSHYFDARHGVFYLSRFVYENRSSAELMALFKIPNLRFNVHWQPELRYRMQSSPATVESRTELSDDKPHAPDAPRDEAHSEASTTLPQADSTITADAAPQTLSDGEQLDAVWRFLQANGLSLPQIPLQVAGRETKIPMHRYFDHEFGIWLVRAGTRTLVVATHPGEPSIYDMQGRKKMRLTGMDIAIPVALIKQYRKRRAKHAYHDDFPENRYKELADVAYDPQTGRILIAVKYHAIPPLGLTEICRIFAIGPDMQIEALPLEADEIEILRGAEGRVYFKTLRTESDHFSMDIFDTDLRPLFSESPDKRGVCQWVGNFGSRTIFYKHSISLPLSSVEFVDGNGRQIEELQGAFLVEPTSDSLSESLSPKNWDDLPYRIYKKGGRFGMITPDGRILPPEFEHYQCPADNFIIFVRDGSHIFFDEQGRELETPLTFDQSLLGTYFRRGRQICAVTPLGVCAPDGNVLLPLPVAKCQLHHWLREQGTFYICTLSDDSRVVLDAERLVTEPLGLIDPVHITRTGSGLRYYTEKAVDGTHAPGLHSAAGSLVIFPEEKIGDETHLPQLFSDMPFFVSKEDENCAHWEGVERPRRLQNRPVCHLLDAHGHDLVPGHFDAIFPVQDGGFFFQGGGFFDDTRIVLAPSLQLLSDPHIQQRVRRMIAAEIPVAAHLGVIIEMSDQAVEWMITKPELRHLLRDLTHPVCDAFLCSYPDKPEKYLRQAFNLIHALIGFGAPQPEHVAERLAELMEKSDIDLDSVLRDIQRGRPGEDAEAVRYFLLTDDDGLFAHAPRIAPVRAAFHPLADVITHASSGLAKKNTPEAFSQVPAYKNRQDQGTVNLAIRQLRHGNPFLYLRELLQNSLDATRQIADPKMRRIEIDTFKHAGALHVSVKDGLGMTGEQFFSDFLPPEKSGKTNPIYEALAPALAWWRAQPAAQSLSSAISPFSVMLEGMDFYRALQDVIDARGGALGGFGFGFYAVLDGADWVRVKTAVTGSSHALVAEYRVRRDQSGNITGVEVAIERVSDGFIGTLVETRRRSRLIGLEAERTRLNAEELCAYIDSDAAQIVVNGELKNGKRTHITTDRWDGLGQVELWDSPRPKILLSGLPFSDIGDDILASLPDMVRKFYETHGFAINLDTRRVPTTPSRDRFEHHEATMAQIKQFLPGLLIKGFLERVISEGSESLLSLIPREYFVASYNLASSEKITPTVLRDARRLQRGGGIDGTRYQDPRELTRLLTVIPFIHVPGHEQPFSLRDVHRLVQNPEKRDHAAILLEIMKVTPDFFNDMIETALRAQRVEREEKRKLRKLTVKPRFYPAHQPHLPPAYQAAISINQALAGAYHTHGKLEHCLSTHSNLMWAEAAAVSARTIKFRVPWWNRVRRASLSQLPSSDNLIIWPMNDSAHRRAQELQNIAALQDEDEQRARFQGWLAHSLETVSHELTHIFTERPDIAGFTHDVRFYGDQMIILLNGRRVAIDAEKLLAEHVLPLRQAAPLPSRESVLQKLEKSK